MRNGPPTFRLQINQQDFSSLVDKYQRNKNEIVKENAAFEAGKRLALGDVRRETLQPIIVWKSARSKSLVAGNKQADVADALRLVLAAKTHRAAMAVLIGLQGVQVPIASAILTVMYPKRFTIIDFRALDALSVKQPMPTIDYYLYYLDFCHHTAPTVRMTLRQFDQALWQWSSDKDKKRVRQK